MDLLFKRYTSPFILLDTLILTHGLSEFIDDLLKTINEEKEESTLWEYFLHKVYDMSWKEFTEKVKPIETKPIDLGATINKSKNMLNNFTPN